MSSAAEEAGGRETSAPWKLGVLAMLYFVQGLPFGFQSKGLKLSLTALGVSMTAISLSGVLSLPWVLKPLLAPFVDRHGSSRFGRRKSWIVPLQGALGLACLVAAFCPPDTRLHWLLLAVLAMNVFAAAQDVPVDGLAVDLLGPSELGLGNAIQVVGYKVGMIVGGGVLVSQLPTLGWRGLFFVMAGLCFAVMALSTSVREPRRSAPGHVEGHLGWSELSGRLKQIASAPSARWVLAAVATYKLGETLSDSVFEPYLVRVAGFRVEQAAGFAVWGMMGSLVGSAVGGVLASRARLITAVALSASVRCVPLFGMWGLSAGLLSADPASIVALVVAEHFFAGMLTTAMFAFMMAQVDKRIGATHFTLLAAVELVGKAVPGLAAGALVDRLGWPSVFLLGALVSVAFLVVLAPLVRPRADIALESEPRAR